MNRNRLSSRHWWEYSLIFSHDLIHTVLVLIGFVLPMFHGTSIVTCQPVGICSNIYGRSYGTTYKMHLRLLWCFSNREHWGCAKRMWNVRLSVCFRNATSFHSSSCWFLVWYIIFLSSAFVRGVCSLLILTGLDFTHQAIYYYTDLSIRSGRRPWAYLYIRKRSGFKRVHLILLFLFNESWKSNWLGWVVACWLKCYSQ